MRLIGCWLAYGVSLLALPPPPAFLLPDDVVPRRYMIDLTIDPNKPIFDGWARIEVELRKPATVIWVNAKDVTPREASIEANGRTYSARAEVAAGEFIGFEVQSPIDPGPATLSIHYRGRLDEKGLAGPYRRRIAGDWYVFTTFTPIDARRAFPCFDEPRFKTPWEMTIHVKRDQKAFANARELREVEEPHGMKAVQFAPTEPLPAEVVAFAVGPFDVLNGGIAGHGTPIRVITPKSHAGDGKAAAQATLDVLPRLEAYTGIPYPFGKLDHLALPENTFSATENPGLITYLTQRLLITPGQETPVKTSAIRSLEAHEIGHQWFGNLVTQATWEDVWLSEGFATWLAAKVMDKEQPPARKLLEAIIARDRIMAVDAGPRTRPVRLAMKDRQTLRGVYSRIIYDKGASILLMLEGWLGENRFREGLRAYLKRYSFGNAGTADLAATLHDTAGADPTAVLNAFLDQTGVPSVRGEMRCDPGAAPRVEISSSGQWTIPVCWRAEGLSRSCAVLDTPTRDVELPNGTACPAWIYLNAGGTGYYRTDWTPAQLEALENGNLTAAERLTLVYDLRALKSAGRTDVSRLLTKLTADPEPEIARAATAALQAK